MSMENELESSWRTALADEFTQEYFRRLDAFVNRAYATETVYPPRAALFNAFRLTPFNRVRAVILGQDPYHEPGQAQGLAFYVPPTVRTPPSLRNIAKELGHTPDLLDWARQGVLLINTTLTVREGAPLSHARSGWETFTDAVIRTLNERRDHLVYLLWGTHAQQKGALVDQERNLVLKAAHPSPLSARRGFFGCRHFQLANDYLRSLDLQTIAW